MITVVADKPLKPLGYLKITGLNAAKGVGPIPDRAAVAIIVTESQAVRWRDDGTAPTSTDGMHMAVLTPTVFKSNLNQLKFIELAASATLHVSFYEL
jgi:hypothetical protein